jgi:hypothetical protein
MEGAAGRFLLVVDDDPERFFGNGTSSKVSPPSALRFAAPAGASPPVRSAGLRRHE